MTKTCMDAAHTSGRRPLAEQSPDRPLRKDPPVRIQVTAPVRSDHFPGRWEDVTEGCIRLRVAAPVTPGSAIAVRTRSLLIRGRIQRCHDDLNRKYLADVAVVDVCLRGRTAPLSKETAGLVRLLMALEKSTR